MIADCTVFVNPKRGAGSLQLQHGSTGSNVLVVCICVGTPVKAGKIFEPDIPDVEQLTTMTNKILHDLPSDMRWVDWCDLAGVKDVRS